MTAVLRAGGGWGIPRGGDRGRNGGGEGRSCVVEEDDEEEAISAIDQILGFTVTGVLVLMELLLLLMSLLLLPTLSPTLSLLVSLLSL